MVQDLVEDNRLYDNSITNNSNRLLYGVRMYFVCIDKRLHGVLITVRDKK